MAQGRLKRVEAILRNAADEDGRQKRLFGKGAATLVRKIWKSGFHPALAHQYLLDHAPAQHQDAYTSLWDDFVEEAQPTLQSDAVHALNDAVALLRRECHVQ